MNNTIILLSLCLLIVSCSKPDENKETDCTEDWVETDQNHEIKPHFYLFPDNPSRLVSLSKDYYMISYVACHMCCYFGSNCEDIRTSKYTAFIGRINDEYLIETISTDKKQCNEFQLFESRKIQKDKYAEFIQYLKSSSLPCKQDQGSFMLDSIFRWDVFVLARKIDSTFLSGDYMSFNPKSEIIPEFGVMMNRFFPIPQEYLYVDKSKKKKGNTITVLMDVHPAWSISKIRLIENQLIDHRLKRLESLSPLWLLAEIELVEPKYRSHKNANWKGVLDIDKFGADDQKVSFSIDLYRGVTEYE